MKKAYENAWRKNFKQQIVLCMGGKCAICGYNKCNGALAFHHIDPSKKEFNIGTINHMPEDYSKIIEELRKCILLCHNCHCELHNGILNNLDLKSSLEEDKLFLITQLPTRKIVRWNNFDLEKLMLENNFDLYLVSEIIGCSVKAVYNKACRLNIITAEKRNFRSINFCKICYKKIQTDAVRCRKCDSTFRRDKRTVIDWPEISVLLEMIKQYGFLKTGKILGVSDNAIRKRLNVRGVKYK